MALKFRVGDTTPHYHVAQTTLRCYAERAGYELMVVNLMDDRVTGAACDRFSMAVRSCRDVCMTGYCTSGYCRRSTSVGTVTKRRT